MAMTEHPRQQPPRFAIIGYAARLPGAADADQYWDVLHAGRDTVSQVPADRWDVEEFFDAEIEKRQRAIAQSRGFEIQDHALALYASCTKKNCQYRNK